MIGARASALALCVATLPVATSALAALSDVDEAMAKFTAILSAQAEHCGLDWERRVLLRYMAHLRAEGRSEEQVALFAAMHGTNMALIRSNIDGPCQPETKAELEELLPQ